MKIINGDIVLNISEIIKGLSEEDKKFLLESFVFEEVIPFIERQLKHQTDMSSWDTTGYRDGAKLREAILKIQGVEPEYKEDLLSKIKALESEVCNYKKYYDWYWKLFHLRILDFDTKNLIDFAHQEIGEP